MNSENTRIWIWLTQTIGYNTSKIKKLCSLYPDITEFYNGRINEWRHSGVLTQNDLDKLSDVSIEIADYIIMRCKELNYQILCIDDEQYPSCLYNIFAPPAVIYISDKLPDVDNRLTIGIVGTRSATRYGLRNSYQIGYSLSKYGVVTISGGALGVDCASHRGSLAADGVTVCVRGCGINSSYLGENASMRRAITARGAVISEYPPDESARNYYFPARNRIIAALSDGVVIIESGAKSGSLITANLALEQGKEVFALLGNNSPQNEGSNKRIKEGSAIPITDFFDILNAFDSLYATNENVDIQDISFDDIEAIPVKGMKKSDDKKIKPAQNKKNKTENSEPKASQKAKPKKLLSVTKSAESNKNKPKPQPIHRDNVDLSDNARVIYEYISAEPVHIDKIALDNNIPVFKVLAAITELEMKRLIEPVQGRRYKLKPEE